MKRAPFVSDWYIKTKQKYSIEELLKLMEQNMGAKYGPFEIKGDSLRMGVLANKEIVVNGVDGYMIHVSVLGKTIGITQKKAKIESARDFIFRTFNLECLFFGGTNENREFMTRLAEEIEKLVSE